MLFLTSKRFSSFYLQVQPVGTMSDNISGSEATYGSNVNVSYNKRCSCRWWQLVIDLVTVVHLNFLIVFVLKLFIRFNANGYYAGLFAFKNGSSNHNIICEIYSTSS